MFGGDVEFKRKYMEEASEKYSSSACRNVSLILRNAKASETLYGKDVYKFNWAELVAMLTGYRVKTENALRHRISVYTKYIDRAVEMGLASENNMYKISNEQYEYIIDRDATNGRYITRSELFNEIVELTNAQDQVLFALLFDGVMGKNYTNLVNLRAEDIRFASHQAKLFDGQTVSLSYETLHIIDEAMEEKTYLTGKETVPEYPMTSNGYVFRAPKRPKGNEVGAVRPDALRGRLDKMKDILNLDKLTGRSIYLSGVADRAIKAGMVNVPVSTLNEWLKDNGVNTNSSHMAGIISIVHKKMGEME